MANLRAVIFERIGTLDITNETTDGATPVNFEGGLAYIELSGFGGTGKEAAMIFDVQVAWLHGTFVNRSEKHSVRIRREGNNAAAILDTQALHPNPGSGKITFDINTNTRFRVLVDPDLNTAAVAVVVSGPVVEKDADGTP